MNINDMQNTVNGIFVTFGVQTNFVFVQSAKKTIASTIGLKSNSGLVDLLGFKPPTVAGIIQVNNAYLSKRKFTDSEIYFILAHECSHIYNNHVISTLFWNLLEKYLKGEKNENYFIIELVKAALALQSKNRLPPNAETLRDQEYEADKIAVLTITHDLDSAISCLTKLVDGNLDLSSHIWELFDKARPAITMRERIEVLRRNVSGQFLNHNQK